MLQDLGPGYHLIPVRDHCRLAPRKRLSQADRDLASSFAMASYYREGIAAYRRHYDAIILDFEKNDLEAERQRRERKRQNALSVCDPMAVQATLVLRSVFQDILMGEL